MTKTKCKYCKNPVYIRRGRKIHRCLMEIPTPKYFMFDNKLLDSIAKIEIRND